MIERRQFNGGIDTETVVDMIRQGDYHNAQNCRVARDEFGDGLAFKPVNSTIARGAPENIQPMRIIGSITDETKGRVYYFMHHGAANPDHTIFAWDRLSNTLYKVLRHAQVAGGLNFSLTYPITGVQIIGDELYWTDNNNPPRKVNVERGIKTNHPAYISQDNTIPDPYEIDIQQHDITVIRRPAFYSPEVVKFYDLSVGVNLIRNSSFQFAYRFKYRDGQYSVLSHYSYSLPQNVEGEDFNCIDVTMSKDEVIDNEIQSVEILTRRGSESPWYIVKTFDREVDEALFDAHNLPAGAALTYRFFNSSVGISVSDSEAYLPFHDIPLKSKGLEIAQNRLFLANNVRGYDWSSATIGLSLTSPVIDPTGDFYEVIWECDGGLTTGTRVILRVNESVQAGTLSGWYMTDFTSFSTIPSTYTITPEDYLGSLTAYPTIADLIPLIDPECNNPSLQSATVIHTAQILSYGPGFKSDSYYKIGIVFYDLFDRTSGVVHDPVTLDIPDRFTDVDFNNGVEWTLPSGSQPDVIPSWAVKYSIVRTTNLTMTWFAALTTGLLKYANKDNDGTYVDAGDSYIDQDAILVPLDNLIRYNIGYVYSEGDAVRISQGNIIHELQVIGLQGNELVVSPKNIGDFSSTFSNRRYIEIYRPNTTPSEDFYYEVGNVYPVLNPGSTLRSYGVTTGIMRGDVYRVMRIGDGGLYTTEVMNMNDRFWSSWVQDIGRPRQQLYAKQKRYDTEIAWSGTYFSGTDVNDLNYMLSGDTRTIDDAIGAIQKIVFTSRTSEYGTVMLAIGINDCASMYLGRSELYNAQEGANVVSTANIIGSVNVLRGGFGTVNPESVVENDGDVYWFSAIKSAFVRYNRNGLVPISDYKFSVPAKWLANKILLQNKTRDNFYVVAGFDEYNKEYLVTTPLNNSANFSSTTYPVLPDTDEQIDVQNPSSGVWTAVLQAGEVYKVNLIKTPPTTIGAVYLDDLYHGSVIGTGNSFQFVAATNGLNTFTVNSFGGSVELDIYKQRINPYLVVNNMPQTWAFNDVQNRWTSTYRFVPDWYGKIGDVLITFKNGILYTHDDTANVSTFHGISYTSWFSFPSNQYPFMVKRYQGMSVETDEVPDYVYLRTELPHVQGTDLEASEFSTLEGLPYGSFLKDAMSPNTGGTRYMKQLRGDDMVGRFGKILIEFNRLKTFAVRMVNVVYRTSAGHKIR